MTRRWAMAALDRPSAIRASTSRSRGLSVARVPSPVLRASKRAITSGSIAVPPAATRRTASTNWPLSKTRSLSRYPMPPLPLASSSRAYSCSTYWDSTSTGSPGTSRRAASAALMPSSVKLGGSLTSTMATSGRSAGRAADREDSVEGGQPPLDAAQTGTQGRLGAAVAVVGDADPQHPFGVPDVDPGLPGLGVLGHVRQQLAGREVGGRLDRRG